MRTRALALALLPLAGAACLLPPPGPIPLWEFTSYFTQVRNQVRAQWSPAAAYGKIDPTGTLLGPQIGRYTSGYVELDVALAADGGLRNAEVLEPSGLQFADAEAIRAFRAAAPFPPPPRPLVDKDGVARFQLVFWYDPIVGTTDISWKKRGYESPAADAGAD